MFYVQVCVVDEKGEQQTDALVTEFDTLEQAFQAQAAAHDNACALEPDQTPDED
ncbi:MAG TPA: hypothetical protein VFR24_00085 [Candidatus Angelobacter sp.]|nr:hypothetical protein [Candidatus Angelobacter sp.]